MLVFFLQSLKTVELYNIFIVSFKLRIILLFFELMYYSFLEYFYSSYTIFQIKLYIINNI